MFSSILRTTLVFVLSLAATVAPAFAQPKLLKGCIPSTIYAVSNKTVGFGPTTASSKPLAGPGTVTYTETESATHSFTKDGSVTVTASGIVASASATFGISYTTESSISNSWSYSAFVPAGEVGRMLVLHRADRMATIKYVNTVQCTTTTSQVFNSYVPLANTAPTTYCVILDLEPYVTGWKSTCANS